MNTPLAANQVDPREHTTDDSFNHVETREASQEETPEEGIDLEDEELADDEMVDDDDNA